jgi:hypothetical protein
MSATDINIEGAAPSPAREPEALPCPAKAVRVAVAARA